ncbi:hypothetical protein [Nonomuraea rhizosphaerae]|uniref:hypothetical protein n=1 Tax=Nonomuraea rhizosphaerae TaxID=2665663 RepID=UPI001C5CEA45|nr:hypothetical protein [Nonomuraea rhizosphaerae]
MNSDVDATPGLPVELADGLLNALATELDSWQAKTGTSIVFDAWLTPGESGALVASVVLNQPDGPIPVIMKVCPPGMAGKEPHLHQLALQQAPTEFRVNHLVEQPVPAISIKGGWKIMFQQPAGEFRRFRALSALRGRAVLPQVAAQIMSSILRDWNTPPWPKIERTTPLAFLSEHLGTRLDKKGPVEALAQALHGASDRDSAPAWIRSALGITMPNIVVWLRDASQWATVTPGHLLALKGRAHGDLHLDNVLLNMRPQADPASYRLIDLSFYGASEPLSRDPVHLMLSCMLDDLSLMTDLQRRAVARFLVDPSEDAQERLQVQGVCDLANDIAEAGEGFAGGLNLRAPWQDMYALSIAGVALLFAMRDKIDTPLRQWFYELSCAALGRFLETHEVSPPEGEFEQLMLPGSAATPALDVVEAVERLFEECGRWTGTRVTIAVIDSAELDDEASQRFLRRRWDMVVDLNPKTDSTGCWAKTNTDASRIHRLCKPGQQVLFGRNSTVWLAGAGLSASADVDPRTDLRKWRSQYYSFLRGGIDGLARHRARPATIVCFGDPDGPRRAVVEACLDVFTDRASLVVVSESGAALAEYAPRQIQGDPARVLGAMPIADGGDTERRTPLLPSDKGLFPLTDEFVTRFNDTVQLLHSEVALNDENANVGAFYRGRPISWAELDLELDLKRGVADDLLDQVKDALGRRDTLRIMLGHTPGAGGTTVARRIAWTLHEQYPCIVARGVLDDLVITQNIADLVQLTGLPVLVVLDLVPDIIVDRIFAMLRASSVPAVLLITARRNTPRRALPHDGTAMPSSERGLRLGPMEGQRERVEMAAKFADIAADRATALYELAARDDYNNVPFFYALTAFTEDFEGLPEYVSQFIADLRDHEREVLIVIALAHRYSGIPIPATLFAPLFGVPPADQVELSRHISENLLGLLIESEQEVWRMTHSLIAEELLRQLLSPAPLEAGEHDWRAALPGWCLRLIQHAQQAFAPYLPIDIKQVLDRLFTVRDLREWSEARSGAGTYTELLQGMSSPGRIDVLTALVEAFPNEPHYSAHLGRLISYDTGDYARALYYEDQAIRLSLGKDASLHHMRGMVIRNEIRRIIRSGQPWTGGAQEKERLIMPLMEDAISSFRRASAIDDSSEYGHIALSQACVMVIEFGYTESDASTYGDFLSRPTSAYYRELLDQAENAIDAAREIRGDDRTSQYAAVVENDLLRLYDDYQALLQGWRNLLDRPDLYRPPLRRRLARTYRNRRGTWRAMPPNELHMAVTLLEENLRDDPRDFRTLLDWLRAARFIPASLDRAADLVNTWALAENSREALFYDYVLAAIRVLQNQPSVLPDYQRKLDRCRERANFFGNRRFNYEWLGKGTQLGQLVHHSDLREWERSSDAEPPDILERLPGKVDHIGGPASGRIDFGNGIIAFCVPQAAGLVRGRDENRPVTGLLAFRYDGPFAWGVRLESSTLQD